jgi:hypothetical protein
MPHLDKKGIHLLHCKNGGGPTHRHDGIQRELKALAVSAGVQASTCSKDVVVLNQAGSDTRRADIMLPQCGHGGTNLLLDVTIANPAAACRIDATINDPGTALRRANAAKNAKYKDRAQANDIDFMPMALECYGALSKDFVSVMHMLCEKRAEIVGRDKSGIMNYWYKRISCTLHKGNARAILKRVNEIAMETASSRDETDDPIVDMEYGNNDTVCRRQ